MNMILLSEESLADKKGESGKGTSFLAENECKQNPILIDILIDSRKQGNYSLCEGKDENNFVNFFFTAMSLITKSL